MEVRLESWFGSVTIWLYVCLLIGSSGSYQLNVCMNECETTRPAGVGNQKGKNRKVSME